MIIIQLTICTTDPKVWGSILSSYIVTLHTYNLKLTRLIQDIHIIELGSKIQKSHKLQVQEIEKRWDVILWCREVVRDMAWHEVCSSKEVIWTLKWWMERWRQAFPHFTCLNYYFIFLSNTSSAHPTIIIKFPLSLSHPLSP